MLTLRTSHKTNFEACNESPTINKEDQLTATESKMTRVDSNDQMIIKPVHHPDPVTLTPTNATPKVSQFPERTKATTKRQQQILRRTPPIVKQKRTIFFSHQLTGLTNFEETNLMLVPDG